MITLTNFCLLHFLFLLFQLIFLEIKVLEAKYERLRLGDKVFNKVSKLSPVYMVLIIIMNNGKFMRLRSRGREQQHVTSQDLNIDKIDIMSILHNL